MKTEYFVTFGQQYRTNPHPMVKYADPDGWLTIEAESGVHAREKAFKELGNAWAMMYLKKDFHPEYFPKGELHRI